MQGKIKKLTDRGFGFIAIEGEAKDLFFHSNELKNAKYEDLREGDMLEFEIKTGDKGDAAVNVNKV